MQHVGVAETLKHPKTGKTCGYKLNSGVVVIGRYETACGGCDTIHSFSEIAEAVRYHSQSRGCYELCTELDSLRGVVCC
jgi:hypothetical protein